MANVLKMTMIEAIQTSMRSNSCRDGIVSFAA